MATTTRKNANVKALVSALASAKKHDALIRLEWEILNTNNQRGHVYNQSELKELYPRESHRAHHGASKTTHTESHLGIDFEHLVIKRHRIGGYIDEHAYNPDSKQTGNQLIDEIMFWETFAETEYADFLCPILKYFTSKSDRVNPISEKAQDNVIIIAQKASDIGDAWDACHEAERLNRVNNLHGEDADERYNKLVKFAKKMHWRDAIHNGGNSGVIFDYAQECYKAVFIDYAL